MRQVSLFRNPLGDKFLLAIVGRLVKQRLHLRTKQMDSKIKDQRENTT